MIKKYLNRLDLIDLITTEEKNQKILLFNALKKGFIATQIIFFLMSLVISIFMIGLSSKLPDVNFIKTLEPELSTQIFDINNKPVAEVVADEDRVYIPLEKISPDFVHAVIAIEDMRFYEHKGIDLKGTIRAFINNLTGTSSIQGGSTITQQLAKNWFLIPEKSFKRKILEALLAAKIENSLSKKEILEKYLNLIYLGNRSYGIERAAEKYFNKKAEALNLAEALMLAGLIKAPELYSPYSNYEKNRERQKLVLERMVEQGFITETQKQKTLKITPELQSQKTVFSKNQYFVDHALYLLKQRYGESIVRQGGLKVYTTLDPEAQESAEKAIVEGIKNLPKFSQVREGALVAIDVKTGYIKAIVGGVDYEKSQFNRATLSKRATGSGFKPIVYLTGLRLGIITPSSFVLDAPVSYRTKWNVWRPRNWDGRYMGKMTVRKALTLSRNTPTVRIALEAGIDNVIETARLLGITSPINRGYSIVLGSAGISPLEVATMYSTLARDGVYIEPTAIRYVIDSRGNLLESNKTQPVRVINSKYVQQLNSILVDVVEKGTAKQAKLEGRMIAGKTGTTDDFKDVWFSGYTPDTATTIWLGNDENMPLRGIWSSNCAALWKNFSQDYYKKANIIAEPFKLPEEEKKVKKEKDKNKEKKERAKNPEKPVVTPPPAGNYAPPKTYRPKITPKKVYPQNQPPQTQQPQMQYPQQQLQYPQYQQYPQNQGYYQQNQPYYQYPQNYNNYNYQPYQPPAQQYPNGYNYYNKSY
ncbi:MAG TPA: transglycosylase domain-containing protein [Candidatus Gastranaerophilales bacterium]|nr:transglycosylase domain-containing protein [Candidatus Gastranaerophilales bacterium]